MYQMFAQTTFETSKLHINLSYRIQALIQSEGERLRAGSPLHIEI